MRREDGKASGWGRWTGHIHTERVRPTRGPSIRMHACTGRAKQRSTKSTNVCPLRTGLQMICSICILTLYSFRLTISHMYLPPVFRFWVRVLVLFSRFGFRKRGFSRLQWLFRFVHHQLAFVFDSFALYLFVARCTVFEDGEKHTLNGFVVSLGWRGFWLVHCHCVFLCGRLRSPGKHRACLG